MHGWLSEVKRFRVQVGVSGTREVKKKSSAAGVFIQIPTIAYRFKFPETFKRHASCGTTADKANKCGVL